MALYDPNEFPETKAEDFTVAEFLAWARTKPARETYNFCDSNSCALAQFGLATGRVELIGSQGSAFLRARPDLNDAVCGPDKDTFGRLVKQLEKLL